MSKKNLISSDSSNVNAGAVSLIHCAYGSTPTNDSRAGDQCLTISASRSPIIYQIADYGLSIYDITYDF